MESQAEAAAQAEAKKKALEAAMDEDDVEEPEPAGGAHPSVILYHYLLNRVFTMP